MTTARIDHVAYIGWRGMSGCEVIDFDAELTGFIGAGGAGKSTMIIALDYALLPDRRALSVRSVSDLEDSHTAGIDPMLGRIDDQYGYAYVVLDITTRHNQRLIAGIYAEPVDGSVAFTSWLIKKPPRGVRVAELMRCHDGDEIYYPDFSTLKRELAASGVDVTTCRVIGEYGEALYDAGILPGPMNSTTDRMLFGNLLGTTFRGGISKDVAARLKDYLLPAQTQVQDLVRGLQDCTNEVLKTRHAVAAADRELALLESTYGIGKEAVLTAIRCIVDDVTTSEAALKILKADLVNKNTTSQSLADSIPSLKEDIEVAETTKRNTLNASLLRSKELEQAKDTAHRQLVERKSAKEAAASKLKQFNDGGRLWRELVSRHVQDSGFEDAKKWFDGEHLKVSREIFAIDNEIAALITEDERLSNERASTASEHLAEILGGQSLEHALGHVSEKEAIALEMFLGGLVDGVVGVDINALADLAPTPDLPSIFWLGDAIPTARTPKETGNWYVAATSGGYIVASKDKAPAFGRDARQRRRVVIAAELEKLKEKRTGKSQEMEKIEAKKTLLLKNHKDIEFYLDHRSNALAIDKAAKDAEKAFDQCREAYDTAARQHSALQDEIAKVQEPYDEKIKKLRAQLSTAEKSYASLQAETSILGNRIAEEAARLTRCQGEYSGVQTILASEFASFQAACMELPSPAKNVSSQQTQRIAQLIRTLGSDAERLESFREVGGDERVSIVRLWPDLMSIVRESLNVELADSDGCDLIQAMREQRGRLDTDLRTWEDELGIKAKNIYMTISGSVRSHNQKVTKLSKLGQAIEFGNVTGIQIKLMPRPRMMDVLQQFADQLTLFSKEKPVDQLLKEFFDATITGGVKLTGEQLLDYRNYVDLVIEVRRKGDSHWELATSLSGTEVIGGGLAIALMLIRSIAVRGEVSGSGVKVSEIRPLFAVDEVGRLNPDGQRLLVDFAKRENFQLVVTAPTIKPTYNCTLYSLTRKFEPHNQLIIRGIKHRGAPPLHAV